MDTQIDHVKEHFLNPIKLFSKKVSKSSLNFIYPPTCLNCQEPLLIEDNLCASCWSRLHPITEPLCPILGLPFDVYLGPDAISAQAIANPPIFDRSRSAFIYSDMSLSIISQLKYGDRPELAKYCARLMVSSMKQFLEGGAILVPVPLHWSRQLRRNYNQANELAFEIAKITKLKLVTSLVKRIKRTKSQVGLNSTQRNKNVAGAFKVAPNALELSKGKRIIIVDDVITTGATVNSLTKSLKKAGIKKIDVISFARVASSVDIPIYSANKNNKVGKMSKITIYTTTTCPYCHAAKALLNKKNIEFIEISVNNPKVRENMMERAGGRRSVPQIFFGEQHIGGFDDLAELDRNNKLDGLLQQLKA